MSEQEKRSKAPQESVNSDQKPKKAASSKKREKSGGVLRWFKDLRGELKKVTWPSAKAVLKNVATVIACVIVVGIFIWVFDLLARAVIDALLNLFA